MLYRQRLNTIGKIGAAISIGAPIISIILIWHIFEGSPYGRPSMTPVFLLAGILPVGWALLLMGREYYDASEEAASEMAQVAQADTSYEQARAEFMANPRRVRRDDLEQEK